MDPTNVPHLSSDQATSLVARSDPWLSCDDCFEQIDAYVDGLVTGNACLDERLRTHLARCPACLDEAESLIGLVAVDDRLDGGELLTRLHDEIRSADE